MKYYIKGGQGVISGPFSLRLQEMNMKGVMGLAMKLKHFCKFKPSKGVISGPFSIRLQEMNMKGVHEACPMKLKNFCKFRPSKG